MPCYSRIIHIARVRRVVAYRYTYHDSRLAIVTCIRYILAQSDSDIGCQVLRDQGEVEGVGEAPDLERVVVTAGLQLRHLLVVMRRHHVRHLRDAPVHELVLLVAPPHPDRAPRRTAVHHAPHTCPVQCTSSNIKLGDCNLGILGSRPLLPIPNPGIKGVSIPGFRDYKSAIK